MKSWWLDGPNVDRWDRALPGSERTVFVVPAPRFGKMHVLRRLAKETGGVVVERQDLEPTTVDHRRRIDEDLKPSFLDFWLSDPPPRKE